MFQTKKWITKNEIKLFLVCGGLLWKHVKCSAALRYYLLVIYVFKQRE